MCPRFGFWGPGISKIIVFFCQASTAANDFLAECSVHQNICQITLLETILVRTPKSRERLYTTPPPSPIFGQKGFFRGGGGGGVYFETSRGRSFIRHPSFIHPPTPKSGMKDAKKYKRQPQTSPNIFKPLSCCLESLTNASLNMSSPPKLKEHSLRRSAGVAKLSQMTAT